LELVASGLRGVLERLDELNTELVRPLLHYVHRADGQNLDLRGKQGVGHGYYGMLVRRLKELCSALLSGDGDGNGNRRDGGMDED
jgi:hypothetical protein